MNRRSLKAIRGLTRRQSQVFCLALRGYSVRRIASALRCKESTVRVHLQCVYRRFSVSGRVELLAMFCESDVENYEDQLRTR